VNIAVNLLEDAVRGLTDSMVIVSGDSDLEPAVEWVGRNYRHIKITVYIPVLEDERQQRRNDNYHRMGVTCKPLPLTDIPRHVFPATVRVGETGAAACGLAGLPGGRQAGVRPAACPDRPEVRACFITTRGAVFGEKAA